MALFSVIKWTCFRLTKTPAFAAILNRAVAHYQVLAGQHRQAIENLESLLPATTARHLLAIPGASPHLVARYLTGVGNVDDVLFAGQVWRKAEATIHAAHKVNRVFIHLLQHDEPFDPPDIPDYDAFSCQWEARMHRYLTEKKKSRQRTAKSRRRPV